MSDYEKSPEEQLSARLRQLPRFGEHPLKFPPSSTDLFKAHANPCKHTKYRIGFRDAKFGIWAHWGPQSAPEDGDWYARNMYMEGSPQNKFHVNTYGHPSKFGFKDVIGTWKGDRFDADYLVGLYKKAGAKYFVSNGRPS